MNEASQRSLSRWWVVNNREKKEEVGRKLESIPEPVESLEFISSLALWAILGCLNHHLDLDVKCANLEAEEQETNLD